MLNPSQWPIVGKVTAVVVLILAAAGIVFILHGRSGQMSSSLNSTTNAASTSGQTSTVANSAPAEAPPPTAPNPTPTPTPSPNPTPSPLPVPTPTPTPAPIPSSPAPVNVTVSANDTSASPASISVARGATVHLTFNVLSQGTYHAGLEFTSPVVDSGSINPGSSGTVTFTAGNSFSFTPWWPGEAVKKDYTVNVNVS